MPEPIEFVTTVPDDGSIMPETVSYVLSAIQRFAGGDCHASFSRPRRSSKANSYYRAAVIRPITKALREGGVSLTENQVHDIFKRRHLLTRPSIIAGEEVELPPSTRFLDSTSFYDYIENIKMDPITLNLDLVIQDPEPSYRSYNLAEL